MAKDLLLVIDMQNVYAKGGAWECPGMEEAAKKIRSIYTGGNAREESCPDVAFTRFLANTSPEGVWQQYNVENASVNADEWSNAMLPLFSEDLKRYPLYTKSVYSSLAEPMVLAACKAAKRVVVSGVVAECCVLSTVMSLIDAGIPVIYLTDGVAGISKETEEAVELILSGLEPLHVKRMTVEEYLKRECN